MKTEFTLADLPTFANIEVTTMDIGWNDENLFFTAAFGK